jgi:hypothetical protein
MKDSCYLTLDGRPVLFIYQYPQWSDADILTLRQMAANAGIEKALYIVAMHIISDTLFAKNMQRDFDAYSWYGIGAGETGESFESLATRCEDLTTKVGGWALLTNKDIIPSFTTGRDTRARIETGVTWVDGDPNATEDKDKPYQNKWAYQPTPDELEKHFTNIYKYVQENPDQTKANLILSYGWNEHEEGGWLCPTLLCDENGNPIKDENGKNKVNDERLRAINKVLVALRGDKNYDGEEVIETTEAPQITPLPEPQQNNTNFYWIIPIVVLGAVTGVIVVAKKKK